MHKKSVFILLFLGCVFFESCSSDDKECTKVTGGSGIKQNGVMVYRVTLDNGETIVVNKATADYYDSSEARKECYNYKENPK